ncbi:MAG: NADH-quinone oxidoreductase subunit J [Anaerolineales bacterium]|uniref:NADH-quinone oxidoreductase subunit J n=1 Tax=Candidatus Villigracilis vicinus TaxID=3140679 RepID=UPI003135BC2F|nr:NADH-quinone oxidoreductase subunit J [Anaerolineales bacterium]MBK9780369.1 NADH-quinone oxidoreductase subunit J [Anaerolineales bacterium]
MSSDLIVFLVLALIAIATALGMLFSNNAVYSALFLVLNFVTVAIFYLILGAPFIAMAQITVYAGAIMVLFLFVIMLLGAESLAPTNVLPWQKPLARLLSIILAVEAIYLLFNRATTSMAVSAPDASLNTMESLRTMALALFNQFLLPFEVTSILLLVAMMGAIVLSRQEKGALK